MSLEHHNRLDLVLKGVEYSSPECGSINLKTKEPHYCDFKCPTLQGKEPMPEPHWTTDPAKVAAREAELIKAKVQPAVFDAVSPVKIPS